MSIWDRFKSRLGVGEDEPPEEPIASQPAPAPPRVPPPAPHRAEDPLERLGRIGLPGGPSELDVVDVLRRARGTEEESRALAGALAAGERMPESVRVLCAEMLVARGEDERAIAVLAPCRSASALMLSSDLFASRGEIARALGAIERVLARDLDAPGAIERHARWSQTLGATTRPARRLDEATIVAATPTDTPFRIDREVARGGAGVVYEAFDEVLERKLAFKAYHAGAEDRAAVEREVRLAAKFAGPGVVRVLDASPHGGWVALEWATQGSLKDWIKAGRVEDLFPVTRWALPLARALARVHAAGFVHADVKPTNVLLHGPSVPLLTDFGIARPVGAAPAGGSAGYVSPERLSGAQASFADDVYGFGRTVEDVLAASPDRAAPALARFVTACLAPAEQRPADAARLVELLTAAAPS